MSLKKPKKDILPELIKEQQKREEDDVLRNCIKRNELQSLKEILVKRYKTEKDIKYNEPLRDGYTLLLHAVDYQQLDMVSYLIKHGANVNCHCGKELT